MYATASQARVKAGTRATAFCMYAECRAGIATRWDEGATIRSRACRANSNPPVVRRWRSPRIEAMRRSNRPVHCDPDSILVDPCPIRFDWPNASPT